MRRIIGLLAPCAAVILSAGCGPFIEAGMGVSSVAPSNKVLGEAVQTDAFARVGLWKFQVEASVGARQHSYDDGAGHKGDLTLAPYSLGARYMMLFGPVRPFVGAGMIGYLGADSRIAEVSAIDAHGAYRVTAGVDTWLPKSMRLSAEMAYELDSRDLGILFDDGGGAKVGAEAVSMRVSLAYRF